MYLSRSKVSSVELRYIKVEPAMCWPADVHVFLAICIIGENIEFEKSKISSKHLIFSSSLVLVFVKPKTQVMTLANHIKGNRQYSAPI